MHGTIVFTTAMAANGLSFLPDSSLPLQQDFSAVFSLLRDSFLNTYYTGASSWFVTCFPLRNAWDNSSGLRYISLHFIFSALSLPQQAFTSFFHIVRWLFGWLISMVYFPAAVSASCSFC
jgi:hypothetical protein